MELFPDDEDNCPCQTYDWCQELQCVAGGQICLTTEFYILFVFLVVLSALLLLVSVGLVVVYCINTKMCQTMCRCCSRPREDSSQTHTGSNDGALVEVTVDPPEAAEQRTEPTPVVVTPDRQLRAESASSEKKRKRQSVSSEEGQGVEDNESADEESGEETAADDPTVDDQANLIHHE